MTNLGTRITVAAIGIPVVVALVMTGGVPFFLFIAALSVAGLREFFRLARERGADPPVVLGTMFGLAVTTVFFHHRVREMLVGALNAAGIGVPFPTMAQSFLIVFLVFMPLLLLVELFRNSPTPARNIGTTVFAVGYISLFFGSLVGLRELFIPADFPVWQHFAVPGVPVPEEVRSTIYRWGGFTVLSLFVSVWVCDSAAYFAGLAFGRHKLFERVSPNKTWEGAVAGFAGAVGTFLLARWLVLPYMSVPVALTCGVIVGVFGQLGDMVESLIKRETGVKDSSGLIPGHGGVLDRFDSLLFVSPLVFLFLDFIVF